MNAQFAPILMSFPIALIGVGAGVLHFVSLRKVAELLVAGRVWAVGLQLLRFAVLGLFLYFCARAGTTDLLAAAGGIIAGRFLVTGIGKS